VVVGGSDRLDQRVWFVGRQRLVAARRSGAVDRIDFRLHPGVHDVVPPRRADPATRPQAALTFEQQHAEIRRGGFTDLKLQGLGGDVRTGAAALEVKGVTVRFGGLTALNAVDIVVPMAAWSR